MDKSILIIGLPGSGKTYLAKTKYIPLGYILFDDPKKLNTDVLLSRCNVVFTDPHLCNLSIREKAKELLKAYGYSVECIFFEKDENKCRRLLKLRNDDRIITSFESFKYTIPIDVIPLNIYEP